MQSLQMPAFRPLYYALLVSAALHLYVLWPRTLPEHARSPVLQVHLRAAEAATSSISAAQPSRPLVPKTNVNERPSRTRGPVSRQVTPEVREEMAGTASLALPTPESGIDAGGLRAYRTALALDLRRSGLLRLGLNPALHGRLELEIVLSAQGQILALEIARGSGNPALDQLALRALREIAPQTVLPSALLGQMFRVVLPLEVE